MKVINWPYVLDDLEGFLRQPHRMIDLSSVTIDTLHGSMFGLNYRDMSLEDAIAKDFRGILGYSIKRIKTLCAAPRLHFKLTKSDYVQQVGFGTYGWKYDHELIKRAVELGMPIDTAEGYGYGRVETELGKCLPPDADVMTKVSRNHMSPKSIRNAALRSRDKLGLVPHYQIHFPNAGQCDVETCITLADLRAEGVIKSIGLGNCSVDMIERMQGILSDYSGDVIRSVQVRYNMRDRRIAKVLLPYCQSRGILVIAYSPLGQTWPTFCTHGLEEKAKQYKVQPAQMALAWLLSQSGVLPIPRSNSLKHLEANSLARRLRLNSDSIGNGMV